MKIYLDNNLGVANVEQEELTQDTIGYNILKVYIPNAVLTPYDTFTCYYGALLQNGRKVGWFAMEARTSTDADYEENYTLYKATLEQCVVSVEGKVYIGCQVLLGNSGNATLIKKNTAVVQFNVRKSVAINNDILVLDPDQTNTDVLESYKNLLKNALLTYATKAQVDALDAGKVNKADIADNLTTNDSDKVLSAKQGFILKVMLDALDAAKQDVLTFDSTPTANSTNPVTSGGVKTALATKADKSDTYTKAEVNETALDLYDKIDQTNISIGNLDLAIGALGNRTTTLELDIADLESVQNVVDVVATKSALNSYDTSKLDVNDKVQVIADESHGDASTIYNWNGSAWVYVGAFGGNSYTKQESDNKFAPKSTAITHTGNQLKDYSGNNIYPNIDLFDYTFDLSLIKTSSITDLKVNGNVATLSLIGTYPSVTGWGGFSKKGNLQVKGVEYLVLMENDYYYICFANNSNKFGKLVRFRKNLQADIKWYSTPVVSGSYIANAWIKIIIDNNKLHIYQNDVSLGIIEWTEDIKTTFETGSYLNSTFDWNLLVTGCAFASSQTSINFEIESNVTTSNVETIVNSVINPEISLYGIGDSIMNAEVFLQYLNSLYNVNYTKYAISGTGFAGTNNFSARVSSMSATKPDIILIEGGTNDFGHDQTLADTKTGVQNLITALYNKYGGTPLLFMLPTQRNYRGSVEGEPSGMTNNLGIDLINYVNAIKEVCDANSIKTINLYTDSGLNSSTLLSATYDGLHWNNQMHKRIATIIYPIIKQFKEKLY